MRELSSREAHPVALDLDAINRKTWKLPETVRVYERLAGWTDPGEHAVVDYIANEVRGQPILDMGVGAGRTTRILRELSEDYIGIDYTEEMVDACTARHPQARILHMDARNLSLFENERFKLVMFSFNGIDAVDGDDRMKVLHEAHRVLQPGGLFVFSAHNRHGPGHGEQPRLRFDFSWNPLKLGWRTLKLARSLPASLRNSRRYRALNETHDDWSIMNCAAHDFGVVVMYTTLAMQKRQLEAAGFECEVVFDSLAGERVADDADTRGMFWFHYVARKPLE